MVGTVSHVRVPAPAALSRRRAERMRDALAAPLARAVGRALSLPSPLTHDVRVRRGFAIRTRDGVVLRTDHYAPGLVDAPTVLIRTPYGRRGLNALAARMLASLGFHVVISSCRGTGDSGGVFDPMRHERADGLDTVDWFRPMSREWCVPRPGGPAR